MRDPKPELITDGRRSQYFWPASAITPQDMALLYRAREQSQARVPISELIAMSIRRTYGQVPVLNLPQVPAAVPVSVTPQDERKVA